MGEVRHPIIFFILILAVIILTGCINQKQYTKIRMEFSESGCDQSLDARKSPVYNWESENLLVAKAIVEINCGENITTADFEIEDSKITLIYTAPDCTKTNTCLRCMCKHELTYKIENLPKEDYKFEIKRIN